MLSHLFLNIALLGAEWILYVLILISILSVTLIFERIWFYRSASIDQAQFRESIRSDVQQGRWESAQKIAQERLAKLHDKGAVDLDTEMAALLLSQRSRSELSPASAEILNELSQDPVFRAKLRWEKNLAPLATIGANAPFVGLFGTVIGIIKAFRDLSQQAASGTTQAVSSGISEALVATAVGILVAIPAVVAFNLFQRKVKSALSEADALRSFLVGRLSIESPKNQRG
jgi:biopolymer transport protein ExbB